MTLSTTFEFVLPRGYVDDDGVVHREGLMRLATARDELEPLRHPSVTGPDDPRVTLLVLARVVTRLGTVDNVTVHEVENLFAADLAYLQDFYGVINFGSQEEYDELLQVQRDLPPPPVAAPPGAAAGTPAAATAGSAAAPADTDAAPDGAARPATTGGRRRAAIQEMPAVSR